MRDKVANAKKSREWRASHPGYAKKYWEAYRQRHPDFQQAYKREYSWRRLGIDFTQDVYDKLFKEQGGVCAICGKRPTRSVLVVDHNHETGRVRGLLCRDCNMALGKLGDTRDALQRALDYVAKEFLA